MKANKGIHIIGIEDLPPGAIAAAASVRPEDLSLLTRDAALNLAGPFVHEALESCSLADLGIIQDAVGTVARPFGVNHGISAMARQLNEDMTSRMRDLMMVPPVDLMTQGMKSALNLAASYSIAADWQRRSSNLFHVEKSLPWVNPENIAYLEKWGGRLIGNPHNSLGTSSSWPSNSEHWYAGDEYDVSNGGKICVEELRVTQGTIGQLGNLFELFFSSDQLLAGCFIVKGKRNWEWEIFYSKQRRGGDLDSTVIRPMAIGFIQGIDLPIAKVKLFIYQENSRSRISKFGKILQEQMKENGFKVSATKYHQRGMWSDTKFKIGKLIELRSKNIRNGKVHIGKINACNFIGIDSETLKLRDPELDRRWYDSEYSGN